eukprot:4319312-Ditylum_brightwellii.AAC.1
MPVCILELSLQSAYGVPLSQTKSSKACEPSFLVHIPKTFVNLELFPTKSRAQAMHPRPTFDENK